MHAYWKKWSICLHAQATVAAPGFKAGLALGDSKVAEPNTTLLSTPAPDIDSVAQLDEEELNDMMEASKDFFGE